MKPAVMLMLLLFLPCGVHAGSGNWLQDALQTKKKRSVSLDAVTAADGLRQALVQGAQQAVALLGRENGYFGDLRVRIPLPEKLSQVEKKLRKYGQGKVADEFILSLNRAAEAAAPEAKAIFIQVIRAMSVQDALEIVRGTDDAATRYFRLHAEHALREKFRPIVTAATDRVGVTQRYKKFLRESGPLAVLLDTRSLDIDEYVTRKALDGLFLIVAEEEKRIRHDPAARASELLRKVFGK